MTSRELITATLKATESPYKGIFSSQIWETILRCLKYTCKFHQNLCRTGHFSLIIAYVTGV